MIRSELQQCTELFDGDAGVVLSLPQNYKPDLLKSTHGVQVIDARNLGQG
jgi:hypothetical protein